MALFQSLNSITGQDDFQINSPLAGLDGSQSVTDQDLDVLADGLGEFSSAVKAKNPNAEDKDIQKIYLDTVTQSFDEKGLKSRLRTRLDQRTLLGQSPEGEDLGGQMAKRMLEVNKSLEAKQNKDGALAYSVDVAQKQLGYAIDTAGDLVGWDTLNDWGTSIVQQQEADIEAGGYVSKYQNYDEAYERDGALGAISHTWNMIVESGATAGVGLVGGALAAGAATVGAPLVALGVGVATLATTVGFGAGSVREELGDLYDPDDAELVASAGLLVGLVDTLTGRYGAKYTGARQALVKEAMQQIGNKEVLRGMGRMATGVAASSGLEGGASAIQEMMIMGAAAIDGKEYTASDVTSRFVAAMATGSAASLGLDAVTALGNKALGGRDPGETDQIAPTLSAQQSPSPAGNVTDSVDQGGETQGSTEVGAVGEATSFVDPNQAAEGLAPNRLDITYRDDANAVDAADAPTSYTQTKVQESGKDIRAPSVFVLENEGPRQIVNAVSGDTPSQLSIRQGAVEANDLPASALRRKVVSQDESGTKVVIGETGKKAIEVTVPAGVDPQRAAIVVTRTDDGYDASVLPEATGKSVVRMAQAGQTYDLKMNNGRLEGASVDDTDTAFGTNSRSVDSEVELIKTTDQIMSLPVATNRQMADEYLAAIGQINRQLNDDLKVNNPNEYASLLAAKLSYQGGLSQSFAPVDTSAANDSRGQERLEARRRQEQAYAQSIADTAEELDALGDANPLTREQQAQLEDAAIFPVFDRQGEVDAVATDNLSVPPRERIDGDIEEAELQDAEIRAEIENLRTALNELQSLEDTGVISGAEADARRAEYEAMLAQADASIQGLNLDQLQSDLRREEAREGRIIAEANRPLPRREFNHKVSLSTLAEDTASNSVDSRNRPEAEPAAVSNTVQFLNRINRNHLLTKVGLGFRRQYSAPLPLVDIIDEAPGVRAVAARDATMIAKRIETLIGKNRDSAAQYLAGEKSNVSVEQAAILDSAREHINKNADAITREMERNFYRAFPQLDGVPVAELNASILTRVPEESRARAGEMASLIEHIKNNRDYLHRAYMAYNQPRKWERRLRNNPSLIRRAEQDIRAILDKVQNERRAQQYGDSVGTQYNVPLPQTVIDFLPEGTDFNMLGPKELDTMAKSMTDQLVNEVRDSSSILDSLGNQGVSGLLLRREELPDGVRDLLGPIQDPVEQYTLTVAEQMRTLTRMIVGRRTLETMEGSYLMSPVGGESPPDGWLPLEIPAEGLGSTQLNGYYAHPAVKYALEDFYGLDNEMGPIARAVSSANFMFRAAHTTADILDVIPNTIGGLDVLISNGGVPPASFRYALEVGRETFNTKKREGESKMFIGDDGKPLTNEQVIAEMQRLRLFDSSIHVQQMSDMFNDTHLRNVRDALSESGNDTLANATKAAEVLATKTGALYGFGDVLPKFAIFTDRYNFERKRGQTHADAIETAATFAKDVTPTSSRVSPSVRWFQRNPVVGQFVTFHSEAFRTRYEQLRWMRKDYEQYQVTGDKAYLHRFLRSGAGIVASTALLEGLYASALGGIVSLMSDEGEDYSVGPETMPTYIKEIIKDNAPEWYRDTGVYMAGLSENGYPILMNTSRSMVYSPLSEIYNAASQFTEGDRTVFEMAKRLAGPFASLEFVPQLGVDIAAGKLSDREAGPGEASGSLSPEKLLDYIGDSLNNNTFKASAQAWAKWFGEPQQGGVKMTNGQLGLNVIGATTKELTTYDLFNYSLGTDKSQINAIKKTVYNDLASRTYSDEELVEYARRVVDSFNTIRYRSMSKFNQALSYEFNAMDNRMASEDGLEARIQTIFKGKVSKKDIERMIAGELPSVKIYSGEVINVETGEVGNGGSEYTPIFEASDKIRKRLEADQKLLDEDYIARMNYQFTVFGDLVNELMTNTKSDERYL